MHHGPFLQSFVVPIWTCDGDEERVYPKKFHGTGFFVGQEEYLITATHVIDEAKSYISENGGYICVSPRQVIGGKALDLNIPLGAISSAAAPYDISVAATEYLVENKYCLRSYSQQIGDDIQSLGYPVSNTNKVDELYYIQARMHKGYIQRIIPPNRLWPGDRETPNIFETNFPITHGMSGSPLIYSMGDKQTVIGVCVASYGSRVIEYTNTVFKDNSESFREEVSRVEEFGIAHDLRPLFDWRPECLGGKRLKDLAP